MKKHYQTLTIALIFLGWQMLSQNIANFTSVTPTTQTASFVIPSTHSFQKIIEVGDALTEDGTFYPKPDFTGYVPIANSSTNGYLSINSEDAPFAPGTGGGGVTVLDINFNATTELWETTASQTINFSGVGGTAGNCSGTVTPWGTVITSEEGVYGDVLVPDGYNDLGWNIEIDPATRSVVNGQKLWAMGNMAHENVTIHSNNRTVYQGADSNSGYLFKFVANTEEDLSSGNLYVFTGSKSGSGSWVQINNTTQSDQNNTMTLAGNAGATSFDGIEDVEVGPDGWVYFAVKDEGQVYRFQDSFPLEDSASTVTMETYVGNMSYDIFDGSSTTSVPWGLGNDNLAFDGQGNLWVLQDGGNNYIWVVKSGHTQGSPDVEIFGIAPTGSEPTGITFTPDYKYLFMSIMHPDSGNAANQNDAAGNTVNFNKGTSLVVALNENLGTSLSLDDVNFSDFRVYPNPLKSHRELKIQGKNIYNIKLYSILGDKLMDENYNNVNDVELNIKSFNSGIYIMNINNSVTSKVIIE